MKATNFHLYNMKNTVRIFWILFLTGLGSLVLIVALALLGVFGELPSIKQLENPSVLQASEVFAADGTLMGKYYRERGNRSNVAYSGISKHVIDALIATEDERFYEHSGIDMKATLRAVFLLGRAGGGSTITQQLALNLFNERRASNRVERIIQKVKEYIIAIRLERNFTKQEILTLYLNTVPFGDNVYGIRIAARTFFQKEPNRLRPEEAAVLIGMLKGNYLYNPRIHPERARERRNVVLGQMERNNLLLPAEAAKLKALPIKLKYKKLDENNGYAPYFREALKEELKEALKGLEKPDGEPYNIYDDGLRIYTTINPRMQTYAEEAVAQQMPLLQKALNRQRNIRTGSVWKGHQNVLEAQMKATDRWRILKEEGYSTEEIKKAFKVKVPMKVFAWNAKREKDTIMTPLDSIKYHRQMLQTAFMVMDPQTGEVKAWVGGIHFKTYKYDHAHIKTKRQVGSTIKPLLYAQAVEERGFTPETLVEDRQQDFGGGRLVPATTNSCRGDTISMASALAWSRNCATAYIMKEVGPSAFTDFLERLNIPTKVDPHPSIALGSCDLSLYEMMWAYSIFPGNGVSTRPYIISRIEDRNGNVLKRFDLGSNRKEVISEVSAYTMCRMMQGTVTEGTAKGLMQRLGASEMGGKTGTTNDNADAWFMGFTPQLLAGTWIGNDDRFIRIESGLGMGSQAARPIWEAFFKKVYADKSLNISRKAVFHQPAELQQDWNSAQIDNLLMDSLWEAGNENPEDAGNAGGLDTSHEYIGPESRLPDEESSTSKDQRKKDQGKKEKPTRDPKIGEARKEEEKKEKRGLFDKLFRRKEQ